jgi:magnesium-transporting ATPase (P-type)
MVNLSCTLAWRKIVVSEVSGEEEEVGMAKATTPEHGVFTESCPYLSDGKAWHTIPPQVALSSLDTSETGLREEEARKRLEACGANTLPSRKVATLGGVFLHQFKSPLIYILMLAGVVSLFLQEYLDAGFILGVILLNAALGTYQEFKAEQKAAGLQELLKVMARVRRDGEEREVDAQTIAPGDLVLLESGQRVPADLRLLDTTHLAIDESILTGESQASEKRPDPLPQEDIPIGDRHNMAFSGTTVTSGRGVGVAIGTGTRTEIGQIAQSVTETEATKTPLVERMESFSKKIAIIFVAASVILGIIAYFRGYPLEEVFLMSVALAVAAIPEGLPVALTVALSIGSSRMAERNVIVRKLMAVEGLGSCTYIASDKTGTLTVNKQTVQRVSVANGRAFQVTGEGYAGEGEILQENGQPLSESGERDLIRRLALIGTLCNDARLVRVGREWQFDGDAVDVSLLALAYKAGLDLKHLRGTYEAVGEIPYESERQFAAKYVREGDAVLVAIKGSTEKLLPRCTQMLTAEGLQPLKRESALEESGHLARQGFRVILIAQGHIRQNQQLFENLTEDDLPELTLLGFAGMIDPLRPEAKDAIEAAQAAGVKVAMVTGDHPETAFAIARQLGIAQNANEVLTGQALQQEGAPDSLAFRERVGQVSVFARVAPVQKLQIVEALKAGGQFVAVTGDGVNDTPALRAANIGVAMGSGSDITKDTASIIVTDDNFASIEAGIEEGRYAYANVRKVILLVLSTGIGEVILMTLAILFGLPLPLTAIQLLWLNVVTNGIQDVSLAFEAGEPEVLKQPPRDPKEGIFDRLMIQENIVAGVTMSLVSLGAWWWLVRDEADIASARNQIFLLMVLLENFHTFNCRSERRSVFGIPLHRNRVLVGGVLAALAIHITAMHIPFMQGVLGTAPVEPMAWLRLIGMASLLLVAMELFKWHQRSRDKERHAIAYESSSSAVSHRSYPLDKA